MQTATTQRAAIARTPARSKPVYPEHQSTNHPGYFLVCLLREQAQYEEIQALATKPDFWKKTDSYQDALHHSQARISTEIDKSLKYVADDGQLLFAHAHTTYFNQRVPA